MSPLQTTTRPDITCRRTGDPIPLDEMSISKWSDNLYLVYCPTCRVMHEFTPIEAPIDASRS